LFSSRRFLYSICSFFLLGAGCVAQREPVLKQIDLPHSYYYREMYLPQLTTGPSAVAWSPNSQTVIYSMAGSLWRQNVVSTTTEQITVGPGYDYQPDCSPDGRWVVFARYYQDSVELWSLDLQDDHTSRLTSGGAVNVEPRFSPDGTRIAFVSTTKKGHFHIFVGRFAKGELKDVQQLTSENVSALPRYYYSQVDHEISPVWSQDGSEILFISNRGHIHGTGGFWRMKAQPGAEPHEIHYEETTWKARPDFSPDGKRMVYASYLGRSWHQLWVMPATGGDAFPISYGDYDNTNPRWSPDGAKIAFISNRSGNTSLWIQTIPSGTQSEIVPRERKYLRPMGKVCLHVTENDGTPVAARVVIAAQDGRAYAPDDAWMYADDRFNRAERPFEAHYFDTKGTSEITVPEGTTHVGVMRGFEYEFEERNVEVVADKKSEVTVKLRPIEMRRFDASWISGDVHVHMNYAGTYRNTPAHLADQAAAENLSIIENLVVNKEQRFPDIAYFSPELDPISNEHFVLQHAQEFHTSYWGHLGVLNLTRNLILPGYVAYANTAAASPFPTNAQVADLAHGQTALVGYVHPLESVPHPEKDPLTYELPADVALGKVDYIEVVGFADHKSTAEVWYKLLNCGFRLPTAGGTDFMGNYASLRGPAGLNRVYAEVPAGPLKLQSWLNSIKAGRTFATNGPLLRFELERQLPGREVHLDKKRDVAFRAALASIVPLDHLQIVCNGKVAKELELGADHKRVYVEGTLPIASTGWCILRAFSDQSEYPILDLYPYATTSPIYVNVVGAPLRSTQDAAYFVSWMERLISAAKSNADWNTETEKQDVLTLFEKAKEKYEDIVMTHQTGTSADPTRISHSSPGK
jgi:TolB protein